MTARLLDVPCFRRVLERPGLSSTEADDVPSDQEVGPMANPGDRIIIRGRTVESADRHGEITEVRGPDGGPPYYVRFDDGHTSLVYPGTDFTVEKAGESAR